MSAEIKIRRDKEVPMDNKRIDFTNIHCTFKMFNVKMDTKPNHPHFYVNFDFTHGKIIITHPKKDERSKAGLHRWLLRELLSGTTGKDPIITELAQGGFEITIEHESQGASSEEIRLLFNKVSSRLFTKKRNYIYELESICFVNDDS
jgi:hypothetical protein